MSGLLVKPSCSFRTKHIDQLPETTSLTNRVNIHESIEILTPHSHLYFLAVIVVTFLLFFSLRETLPNHPMKQGTKRRETLTN